MDLKLILRMSMPTTFNPSAILIPDHPRSSGDYQGSLELICRRACEPKMQKWNICASRSETRSFKLHLMICDLQGLSMAVLPYKEDTNMIVQIEWRGSRKIYRSRRRVERNCTSKRCTHPDGSISWNEGFDHDCKLTLMDSKNFRSWMINLKIHAIGFGSDSRDSVLAKFTVDIAKFVSPTESSEKIMEFPVRCCIGVSTLEARLTVKFNFFEIQTKHINSTVHPVSPTQLLPSLSSCIRVQKHSKDNKGNNLSEHAQMENSRGWRGSSIRSNNSSTSESDEVPEPTYKNLATLNLLIGGLVSGKLEYKYEKWYEDQPLYYQATEKPSLIKHSSWKEQKPRFSVPNYPRYKPLLNKENGEYGGDDIDNERRNQLSHSRPRHSKDNNDFEPPRFTSSDRFEIGAWEERKLVSRDGKLVLETEIFQASIDQRSEKASGGGACTVLSTVIADWLHQNPDILPLRCQFDKLVREGSSEWRNLCESDSHREKFLDQHFDLDTVLQAQVRPLMVISDKSYVGFFELENMPNQLKFLQAAMSFDDVWEELQSSESSSEEKIYIVSWNDHFFVLKVEVNAIYIIDTLGERLFEGCNRAYILKFSRESRVYRVQLEASNLKEDSEGNVENHSSTAGKEEDKMSNRELICEGRSSCKEFIKGFLAALPLRELQVDIERGMIGEAPPHQLLQIEFQLTAPYNNNSKLNMEIQS